MRSPFRGAAASGRLSLAGLAVLTVVVCGSSLPAQAAERSVSEVVLVDAGDVIDDDLYAAGNRVVIQGRVDGDLIASAFEDILISGEVTGDVMGVAASVVVTGRVGGSVRVAAPELVVDGEVVGDVVTLAWTSVLGGTVGGDAVVWARDAALTGNVAGDLDGFMDELVLGGRVEGDVDVSVDRLGIGEEAVVGGDLGYRSESRFAEVSRAEVGGVVVARSRLEPNIRIRAFFVMAKLMLGLGTAVVGLGVMWAAPQRARQANAAVRRSWTAAWLRGALVCLVPLLVVGAAALILILAPPQAAFPVVAVLVPVFLALVALVAAIAFAGPAAAYPWLGDRRGLRAPVWSFLRAAAVVTVAFLLPWVGWLVAAFVVPLGIGGWVGARPDVVPVEPEPVRAET